MNAYSLFVEKINQHLPSERIFTDLTHRLSYAANASFYDQTPQVVVLVEEGREVSACLREANALHLSVTFKAAGTSLSGQCVSDSILIVLGSGFEQLEILDDGRLVRCGVGLRGGQINLRLLSHQKRIGPDPASIAIAKIGGILANNSQGICCQKNHDSYHTLVDMKLILVDGTMLDTASEDSVAAFKKSHHAMLNTLQALGDKAKNIQKISDIINHKYRIRNTVGLSINALIDFKDPIDILKHLMIGSEGTLGFISEVTLKTIDHHAFRATGLLFFPSVDQAIKCVLKLKKTNVEAVEFMDERYLYNAKHHESAPASIHEVPEYASALLVEVAAASESLLHEELMIIKKIINASDTIYPTKFVTDPMERETLWQVRKFAAALMYSGRDGAASSIAEDFVVPSRKIPALCRDLEKFMNNHDLKRWALLGHSLYGNLHLGFELDFTDTKNIDKLDDYTKGLIHLVVDRHDGSMKGEHGTGRYMAPFVEKEWGKECYELMKQVKSTIDPIGILNPGVIFSQNKKEHLQNLETINPTDELIDNCVQCGFCESVCPSNQLTFSPRERIHVARAMKNRQIQGEVGSRSYQALNQDFNYLGIDSCATTGLCKNACPIDIDTGHYILKLKQQKRSNMAQKLAVLVANHFKMMLGFFRYSLKVIHGVASLIGWPLVEKYSGLLNRITKGNAPFLHRYIPRSRQKNTPLMPVAQSTYKANVVYLPSCVNRVFGREENHDGSDKRLDTIVALFDKADFNVIVPDNVEGLCCGRFFTSKGLNQAGSMLSKKTMQALMSVSKGGEYPIVCDASPCSIHLIRHKSKALNILDMPNFIDHYVLPQLVITAPTHEMVLHIPCSCQHIDGGQSLKNIANKIARKVIIPEGIDCCAFAGDKGFYFPKLNEHALRHLKKQFPQGNISACSSSKTCEIGLSLHADTTYRSIEYYVNKCTERRVDQKKAA